jgi:hypothetical protein
MVREDAVFVPVLTPREALTWGKESLVASARLIFPLGADDEPVSVSALPLNLAHTLPPLVTLTCTDPIHDGGGSILGGAGRGLSKIEWQKGRSTVTGQQQGGD